MADTHWAGMQGRELRYDDRTWALTGDLDIRQSGDLLVADAKQIDESKREKATLYFRIEDPPDSLNPGSSDANFDHLEQDSAGDYLLVVDAPGRRYQYGLDSIEYG